MRSALIGSKPKLPQAGSITVSTVCIDASYRSRSSEPWTASLSPIGPITKQITGERLVEPDLCIVRTPTRSVVWFGMCGAIQSQSGQTVLKGQAGRRRAYLSERVGPDSCHGSLLAGRGRPPEAAARRLALSRYGKS